MRGEVLVVVELLQLALLDAVDEDWDLVWVEFADHLGLFTTVFALHSFALLLLWIL